MKKPTRADDTIWSDPFRAALIFAATFCVLFLLYGNRLVLGTNDEGIYLDGAQRLAEGQKLYLDFYTYMSPGIYWILKWSFRLFGLTMTAGRIPVLVYFSLDCAVLYWLASQFASRRAAALSVLYFAVFETTQLSILTAQHRWDSGAISLLAVAVALHAQRAESRLWISLAGALFVFAAMFTPSVAIVGVVTFIWLIAWRSARGLALPFTAGCVMMTATLALVLWSGGVLSALVNQMLWLARNYSDVGVMHYGAVLGGYRDLLSGGPSFEWAFRVAVVICLALPAILPVLAIPGWAFAFWRDRRSLRENGPAVGYLILCMAAFIVSTFPRPDLMHLAYIAAIPYALTAALVSGYLPTRIWKAVFAGATFMSMLFCFYTASGLLAEKHIGTPVGVVRVNPEAVGQVQALLGRIRPGESLFVHPFQPLLYFLTQGKNPTRYAFLVPGEMKEAAELTTLQGLIERPPKWVLHLDIAPQEYLRVFPSADPSLIEYKLIERWIHSRYTVSSPPGVTVTGYTLLEQIPMRGSPGSKSVSAPSPVSEHPAGTGS